MSRQKKKESFPVVDNTRSCLLLVECSPLLVKNRRRRMGSEGYPSCRETKRKTSERSGKIRSLLCTSSAVLLDHHFVKNHPLANTLHGNT